MVLTTIERPRRNVHRAKTYTPVFQDRATIWNRGIAIRAQAMMFAIGTKGYVGSMV